MRLIDADKFKQQIAAITVADNLPAEKCNAMCRLIDKQPTVYDRDKVIERIKQHIATAEKVIVKPPHDELDRIANETAEAFIMAYQEVLRIMLEVPDD